eukprot:170957-Chlamydomonas_euryale.AAC.10
MLRDALLISAAAGAPAAVAALSDARRCIARLYCCCCCCCCCCTHVCFMDVLFACVVLRGTIASPQCRPCPPACRPQTYCSRMRRALASPKYNYFVGLARLVPATLDELHDHVLSNFTLGPKQLAQMDQLNVWAQACEVSGGPSSVCLRVLVRVATAEMLWLGSSSCCVHTAVQQSAWRARCWTALMKVCYAPQWAVGRCLIETLAQNSMQWSFAAYSHPFCCHAFDIHHARRPRQHPCSRQPPRMPAPSVAMQWANAVYACPVCGYTVGSR